MTELADDTREETDEAEFDLEVVDDTPEQDRGREPLPKEIAKEVDDDDFEEYSDKVKTRLKQMKKMAHDERRRAERAERENKEAVSATQRLLARQREMQNAYSEGEAAYIAQVQRAAALEMEIAKRGYREAQELGDVDKIVSAQEKFSEASYRHQQAAGFRPSLQPQEYELQTPIDTGSPAPDARTNEWQKHNSWFGDDPEMTASALGLHQKLVQERGAQVAGTDEYWTLIDNTMRKRFPEYFEGDDIEVEETARPAREKTVSVVAPATRSRASKKLTITQSQAAIAKKLGVTNEQYAKELILLRKGN